MGTTSSSESSLSAVTVPTSKITTASYSGPKRIMWSWQSNLDPWNEQQPKEWQRYSDLEIDLIETEYQKQQTYVELGDYVVDFQMMIQFRRGTEHQQRLVKRELVDVKYYLREERFGFAEKPKEASKSFRTDWTAESFIGEWEKRNKILFPERTCREMVDQACEGIIHEGQLLNKEFEGQLMADQLRQVKNMTFREIQGCCVHLYSMESFLYKLVNRTLRNEDYSKLNTLGAYCWLLQSHLRTPNAEELTVYRGCQLTDVMIKAYKKRWCELIYWLSFTSTSKSRQKAEQFGNTLFIIQILGDDYRKDISSISQYPDEEEVLIRPDVSFLVDKVKYDRGTKKYLIYLVRQW